MKVLIALAILVACVAALSEKEYQTAFTKWMQKHNKSYAHDEHQYRYRVFRSNLDFVNTHNAKADKTFTVATNKFADLTSSEFNAIYKGLKVPKGYKHHGRRIPAPLRAPASVDWRTKGAVTPIKNQEQCGSCWAFSTTGSVEACHFLAAKKLVSLSEQNLVDCSTAQGNQGCDGGLMTQAMDYIISNKGIDTEGGYPYTAEDGTCSYSTSDIGATEAAYTNVQAGSESDLQNSVVKAPTSVAIDASQSSFQMYSSGVYNEPACSSTQLDHGVLAVGYGTDSGTDYWLVKNSWGTDWGMNGYIEMSRNANNQCGIATMATRPTC